MSTSTQLSRALEWKREMFEAAETMARTRGFAEWGDLFDDASRDYWAAKDEWRSIIRAEWSLRAMERGFGRAA